MVDLCLTCPFLFREDDSPETRSGLEPTLKKLKVGEPEAGDDGEGERQEDEGGLKVERLGSILRAGQDKVRRGASCQFAFEFGAVEMLFVMV